MLDWSSVRVLKLCDRAVCLLSVFALVLLLGLQPSAAESPSSLTCNSTRLSNGSVLFQLPHGPSSSSCSTCWEDQNVSPPHSAWCHCCYCCTHALRVRSANHKQLHISLSQPAPIDQHHDYIIDFVFLTSLFTLDFPGPLVCQQRKGINTLLWQNYVTGFYTSNIGRVIGLAVHLREIHKQTGNVNPSDHRRSRWLGC